LGLASAEIEVSGEGFKMQRSEPLQKNVLITGAAGFIGANLAARLLRDEEYASVTGVDNMNAYYDPALKEYRLSQLKNYTQKSRSSWKFVKGDIASSAFVNRLFKEHSFNIVVHLAAQAGVRYSITNPGIYIQSNLIGTYNILEACRNTQASHVSGVEHLVFASSSSVYGESQTVPFRVTDRVDAPVSLYAATKKSGELLAHAYAKIYNLPSTGLRFFTVYGPAGRPDMAYFGFTEKLKNGQPIPIFNYGNCQRDFTYVDDVVEGIVRVMRHAPERKNGPDGLYVPPYKLYNIGHGHPENLMKLVEVLCQELVQAEVLLPDCQPQIEFLPMQPGDVPVTYADISDLERDFGYRPETDLRTGLRRFAEWYRDYYMK